MRKKRYETKYVQAFEFFDRWLHSIEIVGNDSSIYEVYFRQPLLCDFVLGAAKTNILNTVIFTSPEEKIAHFVELCVGLFDQTIHTRELSKWTPPFYCGGWKPYNFFLKNDS